MRIVRDGKCYDTSGRNLQEKRVFNTRIEAENCAKLFPDTPQESYICLESGNLHFHLRTIEKSIQRSLRIEQHVNGPTSLATNAVRHVPTQDEAIATRRAEVRRLKLSECFSNPEIATRLGVSIGTVRKDLDALDLPTSSQSKVINLRRAEVQCAYDRGLSVKETATQLNVSGATIRKDYKYLSLSPVKKLRAERKRRVPAWRTALESRVVSLESTLAFLESTLTKEGILLPD